VERWGLFERFGDEDAQIGIMGWGSTIGPVKEALEMAHAAGIKVAVFYTKMIFPLPTRLISDFMQKRDTIIVPEMNFTGQFARMIQAEFWREVVSVRKYGGVPFAAREIFEKINQEHLKLTTEAPTSAARRK
jgi:2-oxoglutarate ferredoxin oxidoreductase subunit alpha